MGHERAFAIPGGIHIVLLVGLHTAGCGESHGRADQADRAARVIALGRILFFDRALSADGQVACATCHKPERAYSDGLAHAAGVSGRHGTRNTPSILDVAQQRSLFWDGRRARLEDQAIDPLLNEVEHGLASEMELLTRLRADAGYVAAFRTAFGAVASEITTQHIARALAAFERTLVSQPSSFDRYQRGQRDAMSEPARRGWVIFDRQAHCTRCHRVTGGDLEHPLFTDHEFHSLSIGFSQVERKLPQLAQRMVDLRRDGQLVGRDVLLDADLAELGRFAVTLDPRDLGAFKTPALRNVALTAPYMHDGSVATLAEAVDLEVYTRGAHGEQRLILTPAERGDMVAFLQALTGDGS